MHFQKLKDYSTNISTLNAKVTDVLYLGLKNIVKGGVDNWPSKLCHLFKMTLKV